MCGICGKYYFDPLKQVEGSLLRNMTSVLERRGPDEEAWWQEGAIGLGVRRLSIMDIARGHQPFSSEDGYVRAVYNGQIYNYRYLKEKLISLGHFFLTGCDGEVIPHLYEEYGESFLKHLHGMFGLALVDQKRQKLILARDRMGIKPLYYSVLADGVVFGSSTRAILCDPAVSRDFDPAALHCYFSCNYFPDSYTPFSQVKKLLPGNYIVCEGENVRRQPYWSLLQSSGTDNLPLKAAEDKFRSLFIGAVENHLRADVPVGIFLSGGLDSSCIAYAAAALGADAAAFSIGFRETSFDERPYASLVAQKLGIRHYDCLLPENLGSLVIQAGEALDIPIGEPSFLPTYALSAFASEHCKVILSGEGADELLWGYETYLANILAAPLFLLPSPLRRHVFGLIAQVFARNDTWLNKRQRL
ncbi:MAG: asparagine synthase (glutamine-hydrolyzing), partial [Candidatus Omnitrophica bacterium]|nr:asparagine synthase (glutamine-hydrolyzing) [Candidatus Omnitrophota bacterium]